MPSKHSRVAPTLSVIDRGRGPVRVMQGGQKPACPKCKTNKHVVRLWHGNAKVWICSVCFRPKSTELTEQTLKQRILHRPPEEKDFDIREILPNRAARRRR